MPPAVGFQTKPPTLPHHPRVPPVGFSHVHGPTSIDRSSRLQVRNTGSLRVPCRQRNAGDPRPNLESERGARCWRHRPPPHSPHQGFGRKRRRRETQVPFLGGVRPGQKKTQNTGEPVKNSGYDMLCLVFQQQHKYLQIRHDLLNQQVHQAGLFQEPKK